MIDKKLKHVHFIGIKGVAMTALAVLLKEAGVKITGSDTDEVFVTDKILKEKKINYKVGFKKENIIGKPDVVIATGAHQGLTNEEAIAAKKMGLRVITHAQALGEFIKGYEGIAVCGVGGKTTTAAIIATILVKAGFDPSYAIGVASINPLGAGGHFGKGKYFVVEADEYVSDPKNDLIPRFMYLSPKVIVITNIEYDHPDVYKSLEQTKKTFLAFANKIPEDGFLVVNGDNKNIREILPKIKRGFLTYGFRGDNDYQIIKVSRGEKVPRVSQVNKIRWKLINKNKIIGEFKIKVPGDHNILNATAAIITCLNLGVSLNKIKNGLLAFGGTKRRFEFIGKIDEIFLYDDYAHHPLEVKTTLKTAREIFSKKRLICIFQPHTYSRTKALFDEFSKSFKNADIVIITDIYASAREKKDKSIRSEKLVEAIKRYQKEVKYIGKVESVAKYLRRIKKPGDVIFTLGAGDIFNYHKLIISNLKS